nr:hypothetical protein [Escherichia coli]
MDRFHIVKHLIRSFKDI